MIAIRKPIAALVVGFSILFLFAACSGDSTDEPTPSSAEPTSVSQVDANDDGSGALLAVTPTGLTGAAVGDLAPEFTGISNWINSEPLTMQGLQGQVVLVDFWTYTCVDCIRTIPFLREWQEKYADLGLTIVGVHTPEFEFEKLAPNVEKASKHFGLVYPVAQETILVLGGPSATGSGQPST